MMWITRSPDHIVGFGDEVASNREQEKYNIGASVLLWRDVTEKLEASSKALMSTQNKDTEPKITIDGATARDSALERIRAIDKREIVGLGMRDCISPFFEIPLVFMRFYHIASVIVNALWANDSLAMAKLLSS